MTFLQYLAFGLAIASGVYSLALLANLFAWIVRGLKKSATDLALKCFFVGLYATLCVWLFNYSGVASL